MPAGIYEIAFRGEAGPALRAAFEHHRDLAVVTGRGATVPRGSFPDQAALHGLLDLVGSLGLQILDVSLAEEDSAADPAG